MPRSFRYAEIATALRARIESGEIAGGSLLPSEAELSEEHGVSRVTVRRALEELRAARLIDSRQGFGWFVGADPVQQSLERLDTIEHQLEEAGVASERQVIEFGFVATPVHVAPDLAGENVLEVVRLNRADGEPFAVVTVWCAEDLGATLSRSDVERKTFYDLVGTDLGGATQTIGAVAASSANAGHLGVIEGSPLLRVRRVTRRRNGDTVLVSEHLYPAHRTEFSVDLDNAQTAVTPTGLRLVGE